jgi:hypothetical protein
MVGVWRGERQDVWRYPHGGLFRSLLFIWAGMATYGNLSFYRPGWMDGMGGKVDGLFMAPGVSGHKALLLAVGHRVWGNDS